MDEYADIRPYNDTEFPEILERLLNEPDLVKGLAQFARPGWKGPLRLLARSLVRWRLQKDLSGLDSIAEFQQWLAGYVEQILNKTTQGLTVSGIDALDASQNYLWFSNHRDIALDPTLVNFSLHSQQWPTGRIAIGDNLLTNPVVGDLMRLNKSFVVKRSVTGKREKLSALQLLSRYIRHSIEEGESVWLAQREGRAKDGIDETDTAVLKMLSLAGRAEKESFGVSLQALNLVPVSISYEYDPCDIFKARELAAIEVGQSYQKSDDEDVMSIVTGLMGDKGRVHVHYGTVPAKPCFESANALAQEIDQQIVAGYQCYDVNYAAHKMLVKHGMVAPLNQYPDCTQAEQWLLKRAAEEPEAVRVQLYSMYAQPVIRKEKANVNCQ